MIAVNKMSGYGLDEIKTLIEIEDSESLEIYVPKSTVLYKSTSDDIADDYLLLAYAGQQLHDAAETFDYEEVPPHEHASVLFTVKPNDINLLAEALLNISYCFGNDPDEEFIEPEEIEGFLYLIEKNELKTACPYFMEVYYEYLNTAKDE